MSAQLLKWLRWSPVYSSICVGSSWFNNKLSPMEDYAGACDARYLDVAALMASRPRRAVAAVHIGGIAVECQLKAFLLSYHGIKAWGDVGQRARDNYYGKPVPMPGHHLTSTVKAMSKVYEKAKADPLFIKHLAQVMHPVGSRGTDFIAMRYVSGGVDDAALDAWKKSLDYVSGWLRKNEVIFE